MTDWPRTGIGWVSPAATNGIEPYDPFPPRNNRRKVDSGRLASITDKTWSFSKAEEWQETVDRNNDDSMIDNKGLTACCSGEGTQRGCDTSLRHGNERRQAHKVLLNGLSLVYNPFTLRDWTNNKGMYDRDEKKTVSDSGNDATAGSDNGKGKADDGFRAQELFTLRCIDSHDSANEFDAEDECSLGTSYDRWDKSGTPCFVGTTSSNMMKRRPMTYMRRDMQNKTSRH